MIQKKRTLRYFGIEEKGTYRGDLHDLHVDDIKDAVKEHQIAAVIGQFGSGKSTVADMAIQDLTNKRESMYNIIYIDSADLEKLSIGSVLECIIMDIGGGETPFRSIQARTRQARRILGRKVQDGFKNVLVIDNAHRLHPNVLLAMKDEHEKKYEGISRLFSVLYIGQEKLLSKLDTYKEVFWRTLILNLQSEESNWMNYEERINYLSTVYGPAITPIARERIARKTRVPLEMEYLVTQKMEEAKTGGKKQIDEDVVELSIRERREALGISLQELGDKAKVGKSTVHEIEKGLPSTKTSAVEEALAAMEKEQFSGQDQSQRKTA
jgi:type II secretory pathway predicted ATPase ExeA